MANGYPGRHRFCPQLSYAGFGEQGEATVIQAFRFKVKLIALLLILAWAPQAPAEEGVLQIYNWADYVPAVLIEGFEEEYGVDVVYSTYESDELMSAKLLAGNTGFDLIGIANYSFDLFRELQLFMPLDLTLLPNHRNLDPQIMSLLAVADTGNRHVVPYFWGSTGFAYNVDMIEARLPDAPVHSLAMLFDPEVVKHFADCGVALLDDQPSGALVAALYAGYGVNGKSPEAMAAVEEVLKAVRPYIRYFESNRVAIDVPTGEICLSMAWNGDYAFGKRMIEDENLPTRMKYTLPVEGSNMWVDGWAIPADAPNPELAHQFLNYLMRPEVAAKVSNDQRYANAIPASRPWLIDAVANDPSVTHTPEMLSRMEIQRPFSLKQSRQLSRVWARVKADFE